MPQLTAIAQRVFCIPASQCTSERNFSTTGYAVAGRRCSLKSDMVDAILRVRSFRGSNCE